MNNMTIWRRLNAPQAFLILLLTIGAALAWGVEHFRSKAAQANVRLYNDLTQVKYSLEQLDKAFRGQFLDPKSAKDKDLAERARKDINTILSGPGRESILSRYKDEAELLNAGHAIQTNMADFSIYQDSLLKVQE